jgi:hypothetical protein
VSRTAAFLIFLCMANVACADEIADRRSVRSIAAEAAEVLRLHAAGKVSDVYTDKMKKNAREELRDADTSAGDRDPALRRAIGESLMALDNNDAGALRAVAARLFAMAGPRGPAF